MRASISISVTAGLLVAALGAAIGQEAPAVEPISPPIEAPILKPESAGRLEIRIEGTPPPPPQAPPRRSVPSVSAPPVTDPARARTLDLEAGLARSPALYFFLDPAASVLEVRSRGLVLDRVPVLSFHVLHHHSLFGSGPTPALQTPAVWQVKDGPGDYAREVIAPDALRPYEPEEKRDGAAEADGDQDKPIPTPPTVYQVPLTNGWALAILDREPRTSFPRRYAQAVRAGWRGVFGQHPSRAPLVALVVSADDARRIHHIFRSDIAVLVAAGSGGP